MKRFCCFAQTLFCALALAMGAITLTLILPAPSLGAVATVVRADLALPNTLLICTDVPAPPFEFYDEKGTLLGSDVDIGNEIAQRLALKPLWANVVFDTAILAVQLGKCDAVIAVSSIRAARLEQINMVPYFSSGEGFLVKKGNRPGITSDLLSLCGKKLATQLGTHHAEEAKSQNEGCLKAGKPPIDVFLGDKQTTALQQLQSGRADLFSYDLGVVQYYALQQPDQFEVAGISPKAIIAGIMVAKDKPTLGAGLRAAIESMQKDGTYAKILAKWGMQGTFIPPLNWKPGDPTQ